MELLKKNSWEELTAVVGKEQLEEFVSQWITVFCKVQLRKKDLPEHFKEHVLSLMSRQTPAVLDLAEYTAWYFLFWNTSLTSFFYSSCAH